jgi:hypothetical protein
MSDVTLQANPQDLGRCFGVTIRTPAGANSAFATKQNDTAQELIDRSLAYFVSHELLENGPFRLGLVRDGQIVDLDDGDRLGRKGVVEGDVLHLITCEDQVDGSV